ncbi:ankyrin repeat protein [Candidatus Phycorickettsia trachydisci]|uniref:Ankyrin repeat protein n=1 Tax=Candidatus Phycorickettsia trachydisci TaxID=2115978 RepID=A0A2P1P8S5_9RICK|nr:ankyrin repeat domain-containing protein [Candidatus Phycorickettsia trachydisci]AVP87678.1 ankyrin repeat protein [Candidatus Phycorickettsia trachydisci]
MFRTILNFIIWLIKWIRRWFLGDIATALAKKDLDLIQKLIQLGADPNFMSSGGETLLHIASAKGDISLLRILLSHGANIRAKNTHNKSVFEVAANSEVLEILKAHIISLPKSSLTKQPIDEIVQQETQTTIRKENLGKLLHDAILKNDKTQVKDLLNQGANIESLNIKGQTPLYAALSNDRLEIAGILLKEGAMIQEPNAAKNLAIHLAASRGDIEQVKTLTDKDPNSVSKQDTEGKTPLHYVAPTNHVEVAQILCDKGADVNALDHKHNTPLHDAATTPHNNKEMVKFLVERGAHVESKNIEGQKPLDIAKIVKLGAAIKNFEAIVEKRVKRGETQVKQTVNRIEHTLHSLHHTSSSNHDR